jgi:hypothetical protein
MLMEAVLLPRSKVLGREGGPIKYMRSEKSSKGGNGLNSRIVIILLH